MTPEGETLLQDMQALVATTSSAVPAATQEDVVGSKVSVVVDQAAATACAQIAAFRAALNEMEQMLLTDAVAVKAALTAHIKLGQAVSDRTAELHQALATMREAFLAKVD